MKKTLLAAAMWALFAPGCTEKQTPESKAPIAVAKPAVLPVLDVSATDAKETTALEKPAPAPTDALSLAHDTPAVDHLARAEQLKTDGDLAGALTEARRALYQNEHDAETLQLVAELAMTQKRFTLAAVAQGRLCDDVMDDAVPCLREARAWLKARDYQAALGAAQSALVRDDGNPENHQAAGLAQLSLGDLTAAITAFERAVELKPDHGYALNNLGLAYLRANQNEQAVGVLEQAAKLLPHVAFVHNNLGVAYERTGQAQEAKDEYFIATSLSPKYVKARVNASRVAKVKVETEDEMNSLSDVPHALPTPEPMP
ncbi:MAG: tetratricopeptide repeat protein [Myxococcaceae bacterium]|nr:tetratricopeptide repeat protein [Myxococcaceae bacterium]